MRVPRLQFTLRRMMASVLALVILMGVAITWLRFPEPQRAPAPSRPAKDPTLMEGVDINTEEAGPSELHPQGIRLPRMPPDLRGDQQP